MFHNSLIYLIDCHFINYILCDTSYSGLKEDGVASILKQWKEDTNKESIETSIDNFLSGDETVTYRIGNGGIEDGVIELTPKRLYENLLFNIKSVRTQLDHLRHYWDTDVDTALKQCLNSLPNSPHPNYWFLHCRIGIEKDHVKNILHSKYHENYELKNLIRESGREYIIWIDLKKIKG